MVLNLNEGKLFYGRFVVLIHFYILHGVNNNNLPSINLLLCSERILEFISLSTFFNFQIFFFCISTFQKIYGNAKWHIILSWNICFKSRLGYANDRLQVWLLNLSRRSSLVSIIIFLSRRNFRGEDSRINWPHQTLFLFSEHLFHLRHVDLRSLLTYRECFIFFLHLRYFFSLVED